MRQSVVKPQKRKSGNSENFPTSKKLKPKTGYLVEAAPYDPVRASGREIGYLANIARAKTAESLLEFARLVYAAYSRFYEPWKVVGRKSNKRIKEARQAEANWQDFLTELGWDDFPRHQKTVRAFAAIGAKYDLLIQKSDSLPNTVSALTVLVNKSKTERQLLSAVNKCSPETTAAEVKQFLLPAVSHAHQHPANSMTLKVNLPIDDETVVESSVVLAVLFLLKMNGKAIGEGSSVSALRDLNPEIESLVKQVLRSDEAKSLLALNDRLLSETGVTKRRSAKRDAEIAEMRIDRERIDRLNRNKTKSDKSRFANLKV